MNTKTFTAAVKADGDLAATFSRFNTVDHDGDVTLPSAFTDGQAVPMVWSHSWSQPVGRGVIRVLGDRAVFEGRFNLKTSWGRDAYESVKDMAELQEYSYGYEPLESEPGTHQGQKVRVLKKLRVFEVSPVLVGAGVNTGTEQIKQGARSRGLFSPDVRRLIDENEARYAAMLRRGDPALLGLLVREGRLAIPTRR